MNPTQQQWDALKYAKGAPAPIVSINPVPFRVGRSDGNWAVAYEQASPYGNGRKANTSAFWRKVDALAWITANFPVQTLSVSSSVNQKQPSGASS